MDSLEKIIQYYILPLAAETVRYEQRVFEPMDIRVAPELFRGTTCPPMCGGCCKAYSLVYLPHEPHPYELEKFTAIVNKKFVPLYRDPEPFTNINGRGAGLEDKCKHLTTEGRCGIHLDPDKNGHTGQAFSCDIELLKIHVYPSRKRSEITTKLFGRGWVMKRVDGERGALCEIIPENEETKADAFRKLRRIKEWCEHMGVKHHVDKIIEWGETNPTTALFIENRGN